MGGIESELRVHYAATRSRLWGAPVKPVNQVKQARAKRQEIEKTTPKVIMELNSRIKAQDNLMHLADDPAAHRRALREKEATIRLRRRLRPFVHVAGTNLMEKCPLYRDDIREGVEKILSHYQVKWETIVGDSQLRYLVEARAAITVFLLDSGYAWETVARLTKRDHATVRNHVKRFAEKIREKMFFACAISCVKRN